MKCFLVLLLSLVSAGQVSAQVQEEWVARYHGGPGNWADSARALALDSAGNVYVTGDSLDFGTIDYATVKYGSDGHLLWAARYYGGFGSIPDARALYAP